MVTGLDHPSNVRSNTGTVSGRPVAAVWWRLYQHQLRILRNTAIAWIAALAGLGAAVVATFEDRFATDAERQALADAAGVPAFEALTGRLVETATLEGLVLSRWGMFGILVAIWGLLAATRLLRAAEESGQVELLRAGAISPRGMLTSALAALVTVYAVFAVAVGAGHAAAGMDSATAWATGAAVGLLGASFGAVGAVASQLARTRRRTLEIGGAVLAAALLLRLIAAAGGTPDWLWWTTPFGWVGFLHEVDQARATVLTAFAALLIGLIALGLLLGRRDLHGGTFGRGEAATRWTRPVNSHLALVVRLTRGAMVTWGTIIGILALVFGLLASDFVDAAARMPTTVALAEQAGWGAINTAEGLVAWIFAALVAVLVALFAVGQVAAIREEEASWRIEHLLARPIGRGRWLGTRVVVTTIATVLLALGAGVVAWLATGLSGTPITLPDALAAGLNVVPVAVLFLGIGIFLIGVVPRIAVPLTYGLLVATFLLDFVGGFLDLPDFVMDVSPFRHLAAVPAVEMAITAAAVMAFEGLVAAAVGVVIFRVRDLRGE
ncbi:hypothetical protein [Haloechinothrix sp. LS1_15]|uniref:hypothetical protein n=1 Tax=Haloechinothrix sp. LS1_15 TaxID=2652248 RepID=UPI002945E355|nr:hypothetical protein [Haloechinothrix sp. LS1_15]MDV6014242.1 hypothetical protein [Haloechinothrix sp. LS1_15]